MNDAEARNAQIAQRHLERVGDAPRIPPLPREEVADIVQRKTARLRSGATGQADVLPLDAIPEIMFTMERVPALWDALMNLTLEVQGPSARLPMRDRKLAILRTGWLCQAPYEFGEHVNQARRLGFTAEEIERIVEGPRAAGWEERERLVLQACDELHTESHVSDDTWQGLAAIFDEATLIELLVLIGQFAATAYFQNSIRFRLERGNEGLAAR